MPVDQRAPVDAAASWRQNHSTASAGLFTSPTPSDSRSGRKASSASGSTAASKAMLGRSADHADHFLAAPGRRDLGAQLARRRRRADAVGEVEQEQVGLGVGRRDARAPRRVPGSGAAVPRRVAPWPHSITARIAPSSIACALLDPDLADPAAARRLDRNLHLHRLEDHQDVLFLHDVADGASRSSRRCRRSAPRPRSPSCIPRARSRAKPTGGESDLARAPCHRQAVHASEARSEPEASASS